MFNADKFKGAIVAQGLNQRKLAQILGISEATMYAKVKKGVFGSNEILRIADVLCLSRDEIIEIFFAALDTL